MGDFISRQTDSLRYLALILNGEAWDDRAYAIADRVAAIVDATAGFRFPFIPPPVVEQFRELAEGLTFSYMVDIPVPQSQTPAALHGAGMSVSLYESSGQKLAHARGAAVRSLATAYFQNPARDRLRCCPQCKRWFVDTTRNKSARRCQKKCTIAWSNAQRKEPQR